MAGARRRREKRDDGAGRHPVAHRVRTETIIYFSSAEGNARRLPLAGTPQRIPCVFRFFYCTRSLSSVRSFLSPWTAALAELATPLVATRIAPRSVSRLLHCSSPDPTVPSLPPRNLTIVLRSGTVFTSAMCTRLRKAH